jgi:hypothetical protein
LRTISGLCRQTSEQAPPLTVLGDAVPLQRCYETDGCDKAERSVM